MIAFLVAACAALNLLRGRGYKNGKTIFVFLMAVAVCVHIAASGSLTGWKALAIHPLIFASLSVWSRPGWGNGFMAITGTDTRDYGENWPLCELADRCLDTTKFTKLTKEQCHRWGLAYMAFRGLYLLPLFAVLSLTVSPFAIFAGFLGLLQGPAYFIMRWLPKREWAVAGAEIIMGGVIGAAIAIAL